MNRLSLVKVFQLSKLLNEMSNSDDTWGGEINYEVYAPIMKQLWFAGAFLQFLLIEHCSEF